MPRISSLPGLLLAQHLLAPGAHAVEPAPTEPPADPPAEELPPLVKEPQLLEFVQAPYPEEAKAAGLEGQVLLLIEIDETGAVTHVEALAPIGNGFDEAAMEAAWKFRFSPAEDATGPVPVAIEFAYGFVLDAAAREGALPEDAPEEVAELPVNLEGTLLEMGTRRPLSGFAVHLEAPGGRAEDVNTDEQGRFAFRGVPSGQVTVSAVHPGYDRATQALDVVEGEVTSLRLWIRNQDYGADDLIGVYQKEKDDITRRTLTVEEVRRIPGTFGDPVRVIQNLPGAARSPFGSGLLVIRGADPLDSAVYVDGIRVPLIYHLGGYESVLAPDLVDAVDYLPGGYGVEYGRTLGGVVDVRTKREFPEGVRAVWSTDLLDSGGVIEGRAGKEGRLGFAVAGRRSYIDVFIPLFIKDPDTVVKPRWYDYQLKLQHLGVDNGELSAFVFGYQDDLLASSPGNQGTDQDTQGELGTTYSTHRVNVVWERNLGETLRVRVVPSMGIDGASFTLGDSTRLDQTIYLAELRSELSWQPSPVLGANLGLDVLGGYYDFSVELPFNPSLIADYDPIAEREDYAISGTGTAWGPDAYLELEVRPLKDPDRMLLKPGVRVNYVSILDQFAIVSADPRLAARWEVFEGGTAKLGLGLYHQPPQPFESYRPDGNVQLGYERAWSSEFGWEQQITPALSADATVFYKWLDHLIVANPELTSLDDPYFFNDGVGRIYGLEVFVRHALVNRFFGWVSYTLSRSERNDYPDLTKDAAWFAQEGEGWYLFELDQTHILVALAGYRLPYDFEISGKFRYVSGNPYTPYAGGVYDIDQDYYFGYQTAAYNSERLPPYITADARFSKLFTFKRWQLEAYVDLLNAVRGVNPEFVIYNYDYTESRYLRGLPFIPSPGFEAEFHF